jgi:hypothetical protein
MAFDWREYFALAQWLQTNTPPGMTREGAHRSAIGRAYYAAFGYARDYARDYLGFTPRNDADDHGRLRNHLKRSRRRATADSLDRLREWRNSCDYESEFTGDLAAVHTNALTEAQYVFNSLPPPAPPSSAKP